MTRTIEEYPSARRLSVARVALTGMLTASLLYGLCWLAARLSGGAISHLYLQLFTTYDINSGLALVEGLIWSWVAGSLAGSLIASIYNGLTALER